MITTSYQIVIDKEDMYTTLFNLDPTKAMVLVQKYLKSVLTIYSYKPLHYLFTKSLQYSHITDWEHIATYVYIIVTVYKSGE